MSNARDAAVERMQKHEATLHNVASLANFLDSSNPEDRAHALSVLSLCGQAKNNVHQARRAAKHAEQHPRGSRGRGNASGGGSAQGGGAAGGGAPAGNGGDRGGQRGPPPGFAAGGAAAAAAPAGRVQPPPTAAAAALPAATTPAAAAPTAEFVAPAAPPAPASAPATLGAADGATFDDANMAQANITGFRRTREPDASVPGHTTAGDAAEGF